MDDRRKDEIGRFYLLRKGVVAEECRALEIQELLFLIQSAKHFKEAGAFVQDDLDEKLPLYHSVLLEKIREAEELLIAYDVVTQYPFLDWDGRVWLFSKEAYALDAQDYYLQQMIRLEMRAIPKEERMKTFADLHVWGMRRILVDNGQYQLEVDRDEVLPPPDWSDTPPINEPVTNPGLQHAMIGFFQNLYARPRTEESKPRLNAMEARMLDEALRAKYLVPMQLNEREPSVPDEQGTKTLRAGTTLQFAQLMAEDDTAWLPAFTDWAEFDKLYDRQTWSGNIAAYDDLLALSARMDGIVVNAKGISFRINAKSREAIEAYRKARDEAGAAGVAERVVPANTRVLLGEPADYPREMIAAVAQYMKGHKQVKEAYLRLMMRGEEKSYLIAVDYEGSRDGLFGGIAAAASPHLSGMPLDLTDMEDWVKESLQGVAPFYKRKRFGLF